MAYRAARGVGAYGHKLRRATATERVAGTDPVAGAYVQRGCRVQGRGCVEAAEFIASYYLEDAADHRPRLFRRALCARHAKRFAERHHLEVPPPLTTDQELLPFGGTP